MDAIRVLDECVYKAPGGSIKEGKKDRTASHRPIVTDVNWQATNSQDLTRSFEEANWFAPGDLSQQHKACKQNSTTKTMATNTWYKFKVPGDEDGASLLQALWAAQPKQGPAAPQAKAPTKRKESRWLNSTNSEQILMEIKTTLEAVESHLIS